MDSNYLNLVFSGKRRLNPDKAVVNGGGDQSTLKKPLPSHWQLLIKILTVKNITFP